MNKRKTGAQYEQQAAEFLEKNGARILERNFRCRMGEVDIISEHRGVILFVEVKFRSRAGSGHPSEAVTFSKQRIICRTADYYRMMKHLPEDRPYRFDVISILGDQIDWIKGAFEYMY